MARWLKKSRSGWTPCPLTYPPKDPEKIKEQYVAWLIEKHGANFNTEKHILAMCEAAQSTIIGPTMPLGNVRAEESCGAGIRIRKIVTYDKGEHYVPEDWTLNNNDNLCGWHRFHNNGYGNCWTKSDSPTIYEVQRNGKRIDGFLTRSAAKELALRLIAAT